MRDIIKKILTVALSAVLVFVALVPVPVGNQRVDSVTHQKAEAAVPAVAVPVIAATVLAACGVYIVGTTEITYNGNRTTVANALVQYLGTTIYDGTEAASDALSSCVTPEGNIDLGALAQTGILGAIPAFASLMMTEGIAADGEVSTSVNVGTITVGSNTFAVTEIPHVLDGIEEVEAMRSYIYAYAVCTNAYWDNRNNRSWNYYLFSCKNVTSADVSFASNARFTPMSHGGKPDTNNGCINVDKRDGTVYVGTQSGARTINADGSPVGSGSGVSTPDAYQFYFVSNGYEHPLVNGSVELQEVSSSDYAAVVSSYTKSADFVAPETTVEPFEPTVEQLEAGYDSTAVIEAQISEVNGNLADVIARINAQTQTLSGIGTTLEALRGLVNGTATNVDAISIALNTFPGLLQGIFDAVSPLNNGLSGILTALNPLAAILSAVTSILGVLTGLQASPFTWLSSWWGTLTANWQELLDWLGATPFGQAVGGVIDALGQVGAGVAAGAADVLGGVQALGQTLAGELQGVLDGVLSIPASIAATLDGILAAEAEAKYTPSGEGLRLRDELRAQLEAQLDMKAPFCYMRRMQALASTISGNFGGSPSFYFDVDMPYAGVQRFDAGELLNQEWGTLTLAQYIRVMITATLCAGLLAVSLKIAIGRIGNKEG